MKKLIILAEGLFLVCGIFTLSACFYGPRPDPAYGYARSYGYNVAPPVVVGDYDERHVWHDRDWWMANHHDWVEHHHPDWDNQYHRG
jgi:hypothetical protein